MGVSSHQNTQFPHQNTIEMQSVSKLDQTKEIEEIQESVSSDEQENDALFLEKDPYIQIPYHMLLLL